ncbi:MAG TPA: DUF2127 domain-containing protein [Pseudolysinimonas sp.]|nr:DUF2127 domain-containing protein [Pseudolysinimonas sp.]
MEERRPRTTLDRVFAVGVVIKGIDGAVELIAGFLLWLAPGLVDAVLRAILGEAARGDGAIAGLVATGVAHADVTVLTGGTGFLILFLIAHGVIKLVLVYCLLRRIIRAYPWALLVLVVFLGYQVWTLIAAPSVALALFVVLDVVIIVLVWREYRELRRQPQTSTGPDPAD